MFFSKCIIETNFATLKLFMYSLGLLLLLLKTLTFERKLHFEVVLLFKLLGLQPLSKILSFNISIGTIAFQDGLKSSVILNEVSLVLI